MLEDVVLFVTIAEIAGVFVGFAALIAVTPTFRDRCLATWSDFAPWSPSACWSRDCEELRLTRAIPAAHLGIPPSDVGQVNTLSTSFT